MAEAFIVFLLENLNSLTQKGIGRLLGVNKQIEKFSSLLSAICAVLEDAEGKQLTDRAIKDWLQKLNDVSYELDDVLDDCELEAYRLKNRKWTRKVRSSLNVMFRIKIANKMKEIGGRLDEIANERMRFHLQVSAGEMRRSSQVREHRRTSSSISEPHVYGRVEEREKVVNFLVNDATKCSDLSVFPIFGLGGLGKTTLAKYVYNDERVNKHFEVKLWVCVSEDFDVKRLIKEAIESATNTGCEALELDPLQKRLQNVLKGKRFLLVLDDVWNEDQDEWEKLKYGLACGSIGSSLVVTTRLKTVASIMGTVPMQDLSCLSEDDCWSLFKQRAFGSGGEERPNLVKIGKDIVKKCKGLPLAAKALGGLLFFKKEESEWFSVLHNELWNLPEDKVKILPELRLSYFQLPIVQRRCFAYCAIFPKDYKIHKNRLIHLWIANGLISSRGGLEMEDIGREILDELCWISFMQEEKIVGSDLSYFYMHDLVHDLAQSIMKEECRFTQVGDFASHVNLSKRVRHLICQTTHESKGIEIQGAHSLRTFLDYGRSRATSFHLKSRSLRAFHGTPVSISSFIRNMKHLRYLNISYSRIKILPDSLCSLHHLLALHLSGCRDLQELPKRLNHLRGLRHLYINSCDQLSGMPPHIGRLTRLKTLTTFIVTRNRSCGLEELGSLDLGYVLQIENLDEVRSSTEAKSANLSEKKNLKQLQLSWSTRANDQSLEKAERVLEALVPSPNLICLNIHNFKGVSFPFWMSNEILGNVTKITLSGCENCVELPPLGTLASLHELNISRMNNMQYMDSQSYDGQVKRCFVQLKLLQLEDMPNLERLSREEGREMFPCLSELKVTKCPKLMFSCIESIKELSINEVTELSLRSIKKLCGLTKLILERNDQVTYFSGEIFDNLSALRSLSITQFTALEEISGDMLIGCRFLERLDLSLCAVELKCFPDRIFRNSTCLQHIAIKGCKNLKSLSDSFGELTALESLRLHDCPVLEGFPSSLKHLSSLRELTIMGLEVKFNSTSGFSCSLIASHKLADLPEAFQHLTSLESMTIGCFKELASLPDWIGNLQSLRELCFIGCPDLAGIPASFKRLTNLKNLSIDECPKLEERCQKEVGEDWDKISHIPHVYVGQITWREMMNHMV